MRRYSVFFVVFPFVLIFIRLGIWQVDRLHQRRALNAALTGNRDLPAVDLSNTPPDELPRFRRITANGFFDFDHQVVVDAREFEGVPSVVLVTPLRMPAGKAVLVERGSALSLDAHTLDPAKFAENDSATVSGLVVLEPGPPGQPPAVPGPWPPHVQWLNPARLAPLFPYEILPYVIRRQERPASAPRGLIPVPVPELDDGPHLSYALQWFSFAIIAAVGSVALFKKGEEGRGKGEE